MKNEIECTDLNQYVKDAVRTECRLDELNLNKVQVMRLFSMYIELGEILDGLKKAVFYNNSEKYKSELDIRMAKIHSLTETSDSFYDEDNKLVYGEKINNICPRVFHGILGILTESSELAEIIADLLEHPSKEIDPVHVQEELGDSTGWYNAIIHSALNLSMKQTLEKNISKLKIRYPEKYSDVSAANRNLQAEREVLE